MHFPPVRVCAVVLTLLLLQLAPLRADIPAPPQVPLRVELKLAQPVVLATPLVLKQATANATRLAVDATPFTVALVNEGGVPLRVNTYTLTHGQWRFEVTGPQPDSVQVRDYQAINRLLKAPDEQDVVTIPAGGRWECPAAGRFPGQYEGTPQVGYGLQHAGEYQVRVVFDTTPVPRAAGQAVAEWEMGLWQGISVSAPCPLRVVRGGPAANGLRAGLDLIADAVPGRGSATVLLVLKNESDRPWPIQAWELSPNPLLIQAADGTTKPLSSRGRDASRELTAAEQELTLAPGATTTFVWSAKYYAVPQAKGADLVVFAVTDRTGLQYSDPFPVVGPLPALVAHYAGPVNVDRARLWTGEVSSLPVPLMFDPTPVRAAALKAGIANFRLDLTYQGEQDKPFYTLHAQTWPLPQQYALAVNRAIQLTPATATTLIDGLAASNLLRQAEPLPAGGPTVPPVPTGYRLTVHADGAPELFVDLGWDSGLIARLTVLKDYLPKDGQVVIEQMLARLSGYAVTWQAADALQQRYTLVVPAGQTLTQAIMDLQAQAGLMSWHVALPGAGAPAYLFAPSLAATRSPALPALQFRDVTGASILRACGAAIGHPCTVDPATATITYK